MLRFPTDKLTEGTKLRRKSWAKKDYVLVEGERFYLIAYGAVKFSYTLTPQDAAAFDWEILSHG